MQHQKRVVSDKFNYQTENLLTPCDCYRCSKDLNQWDYLLEFAGSKGNSNPHLVLESAWRVPNWTMMKEALAQVNDLWESLVVQVRNTDPAWFVRSHRLLTKHKPAEVALTWAMGGARILGPRAQNLQPHVFHRVLQVEMSCAKEMAWKVNLYRGYIAICHPEETHLSMIERLVEVSSSLAIKEWRRLPSVVSHIHVGLLQVQPVSPHRTHLAE